MANISKWRGIYNLARTTIKCTLRDGSKIVLGHCILSTGNMLDVLLTIWLGIKSISNKVACYGNFNRVRLRICKGNVSVTIHKFRFIIKFVIHTYWRGVGLGGYLGDCLKIVIELYYCSWQTRNSSRARELSSRKIVEGYVEFIKLNVWKPISRRVSVKKALFQASFSILS